MVTTNPNIPPPPPNNPVNTTRPPLTKEEELFKKLDHGQLYSRLAYLRNKATAIPPTEMYLLLNPSTVFTTAEQHLMQGVRTLEAWRNFLVLVPLLLTWFGLSTASDFYAQTLKANPHLVEQPFLKMWVDGFPDLHKFVLFGLWDLPTFLVPSFSLIAGLDASLFLVLIVLTVAIHWIESQAQTKAHNLVSWLQEQLFQLENRSIVLRSTEGPDRELALDRISDIMNRTQEDLDKLIEVVNRVATAADRLDIIFQRGQEVYDKLDQTLPHLTQQFDTITDRQKDAATALQSIATGIKDTAAAIEQLARPFAAQDLASIARRRDAQLQKSVEEFSAVVEKQEKIATIMGRFSQEIGDVKSNNGWVRQFFKRLVGR